MRGGEAVRTSWFPSGIVLLPGRPATTVPGPRLPEAEPDQREGTASRPVSPASAARAKGAPTTGWTIVDACGEQVAAWPTHRQAMWDLGRHALRGARLPLLVHGPDGRPTGDRLG